MSDSKKDQTPGAPYSNGIYARVWLNNANKGYFGVGRIQLLEHIEQMGSISKAAKSMGMSYKRAWNLVESMNQAASQPVIIRETGGKGGGGTQLTDHGRSIIEQYRQLEDNLIEFLEAEEKKIQI